MVYVYNLRVVSNVYELVFEMITFQASYKKSFDTHFVL